MEHLVYKSNGKIKKASYDVETTHILADIKEKAEGELLKRRAQRRLERV